MSNIQRFENLKQVVVNAQTDFESLAKLHGAVNYQVEASFALQILTNNDYLASIAMNDQDSLKRAVINVAAIGLTLNPIQKLAYLIPRKKQVCLDISYLGLIKLATDCGAVKLVHSEIVYEKDAFRRLGLGVEPIHEFDPFADRGAIRGAYCLAKTHDGEYILTHMSIKDIYSIRDRSESWKAGGKGPWLSDESEMIKKTVIRRAYKSWPKTDSRLRFEEAIDVTNQADPIDFEALPAPKEDDLKRADNIAIIRSAIDFLQRSEEAYIKFLCEVNRREIKKLDDLTDIEIDQALILLNQWIESKKKKDAAELEKKKQSMNPLDILDGKLEKNENTPTN